MTDWNTSRINMIESKLDSMKSERMMMKCCYFCVKDYWEFEVRRRRKKGEARENRVNEKEFKRERTTPRKVNQKEASLLIRHNFVYLMLQFFYSILIFLFTDLLIYV